MSRVTAAAPAPAALRWPRCCKPRKRPAYWKLLSRIFPENTASRALMAKLGFREVGIYRRHGKLDGVWRDCVIVERLLGEAAE